MKKFISLVVLSIVCSTYLLADVFMTELTDPQNSSDAGRYVELYNNGDASVDLSAGWTVQRWTNANPDPTTSTIINLAGTISPGGFYIICNDADKFSATFGGSCDQDIGTGGFADSNGDDNMAILLDGVIIDMFGVAGEDGTGTGHEFEDGRAERADSNTSASATWDASGWNIDNDSGGGDGNQYAPEGFDPGAWIGAGPTSDTCDDEVACNTGSEGDCEYPDSGYDCDGNCVADFDCAGVCNGDSVVDECGECGGDGSACAEPAANLFFSEHAEGSSSNKYFEVFNASDADVSLDNYAFVNCSNGCEDWEYTTNFAEGASVAAGDVYVVCHGSFAGDLSVCDETRTLYHNGDDAQGLMHTASNTLLDVFGAIGDDPGSGWEAAGVANATKDHTLVRKASVESGNTDWTVSAGTNADDSEWVVLDQNTWDYMGSHPHNFDAATVHTVEAGMFYYSPASLAIEVGDVVSWDNLDGNHDVVAYDGSFSLAACGAPCTIGEHTFTEAGSYDYYCSVGNHEAQGMVGNVCVGLEYDDCGVCGGDGSSCVAMVTFSVDMSIEGVVGDVKVRTSTVDGEYNPSDWYVMDDSDGDMVYSYTMSLASGVTYGYNFNNSDGSGYESGSGLGDCAGGNYGNDRYITPEGDTVLDAVCWESCEACPAIVEGCTDETATNYDSEATVDDGSCEYDEFDAANLFISEAAEGSSNNKYIEIYNASDQEVYLSGYGYPNVSNAPSTPGEYEYWNSFAEGAMVDPGDVYVICHGSSDDFILNHCDEEYTYLSNGDDGLCLVAGSEANYQILDCVGDWNGDPGSGWDVAGVSSATKDHTLVRKSSVETGNGGDWTASAGTNEDDSEWIVYDQNTWDYLGSHPHDDIQLDCEDESACNFMEPGDCVYAEVNFDCDGNCVVAVDCNGECGGDAVTDECGECGGDGSSCACIPGDANDDGAVDVLDIVMIVSHVLMTNPLSDEEFACSDMNADGAVDVLDIVDIVNLIVNGRVTSDATEAKLNIKDGSVSLDANGFVGAVQMTLSHDASFSIELTDKAMVADYKTNANSTTLIVVAPESSDLFKVSGDFSVEEVIVAANAYSEVAIAMPTELTLSQAYPNPFNPSTTMDVYVPADGVVKLSVYNVMGQMVDVIHSGSMSEGNHSITWNASDLTSGMYFVRAESTGGVAVQKVMLMK